MKLSVSIITLNEESKIEECLKSVKGIADEIVVVDCGSEDKTIDIAKKYGAKVFNKKFVNFADQKNYALKKTTGEWIFSIDADETIERELEKEIVEAIRSDKYCGYSIPRKNIILGKFIKYSRWQPELDRHIWLWKKGKGEWIGDVHEEIRVDGLVGKLKHSKIHKHYDTLSEFVDMINRYSQIEAEEYVRSGGEFNNFRFVFDPIYNFIVRYVYRLGFLDGVYGFVLCMMMGFYHMILWSKVWTLKQKN